MGYTSRMVALLARIRREMNGAVVESMRYYGKSYGLNYGVSLHTLRDIAREEGKDHGFALYLYRQEVRELHLAALHIACPDELLHDELGAWAAGIINSEVAEEAAYALLPQAKSFEELFLSWTSSSDPLLQYAALLAAARREGVSLAYAATAVDVVRRNPEQRLPAKGAVALMAAVGTQNEVSRDAVRCILNTLDATPSADYLREELAWRLEV